MAANNLIESLRPEYRAMFEAVRSNVKERIWDAARCHHFTIHSLESGAQLLEVLSSFVERLPENKELGGVERFLLATAAYLYDIGMEAPSFELIGIPARAAIDWPEMEQIRRHRARLSAEMIGNSSRRLPDYPFLGLTDEGTLLALADICGVQDRASLDLVTETDRVLGEQVRLRLLASLLLLADQLFISHNRVNMAVLNDLDKMPVDQHARWWIYNYVEQVWIDEADYIRVKFEIPEEHADITEAICNLVIRGSCNQVQTELWKIGIKTFPGDRPRITYVPENVPDKKTLPPALEEYVRTGAGAAFRGCTLFVDYEGIRIFLGRHNQFELSAEYIVERLIATAKNAGPVTTAFLYADWDRYKDEMTILHNLKSQAAYHMLELVFHLEENGSITNRIARDSAEIAQQRGRNHNFVIVCSQPGLEDTIQSLQQHGNVIVWADGSKAEHTYKKLATTFASIDNVLGQSLSEHMAWQLEKTMLQLIAIIVDYDLIRRDHETLGFGQVMKLLTEYPIAINRWSRWWTNLAISQGILRRAAVKLEAISPYELDTMNPLVQEAFELRAQVLETLDTLTEKGAAISIVQLDKALRTIRAFSNDDGRRLWLTVLRKDGMFEEIASPDQDMDARIRINRRHPICRQLLTRQHLDGLIVTMHNLLIENPRFSWLTPRIVKERLRACMEENVIQPTLNLADRDGMIRFEQREATASKPFTAMYLVEHHARVAYYLACRDTVILFSHDWFRTCRDITGEKLETLLEAASFGDSQPQRLKWISLMKNTGVLTQVALSDFGRPIYRLNDTHPVVRRVLAPYYLNWLLYNLRAYQPTNEHPFPGAWWTIKNMLPHTRSEPIAEATLDLAIAQRLVVVRHVPHPTKSGQRLAVLELTNEHKTLWAKIEEQAASVTNRLVELLLQRENWFSIQMLFELTRPYEQFGRLDAERFFWIQQLLDKGVLIPQARRRPNGETGYKLQL